MTSEARTAKGMWWDRAWTLTKGCTPVSPGCDNCWSAEQSSIRGRQSSESMQAIYGGVTDGRRFNGHVEPLWNMLNRPLHVRKPTTWAVWNDLWHEALPEEFVAHAYAVMCLASWHTFIVLTKRPARRREMLCSEEFRALVDTSISMILESEDGPPLLRWDALARRRDDVRATAHCMQEGPPPNVWEGTTVEDQQRADERLPDLLATPAAVRFVSGEPLLGPVSFDRWFGLQPGHEWAECLCDEIHPDDRPCLTCDSRRALGAESGLHWVIVGGESGPRARPCDVAWIRSVVEQCKSAAVSVFVKQLGARPVDSTPTTGPNTLARNVVAVVRERSLAHLRHRSGADPAEWPEDLRVREYPEVRT